MAAPPGPSEKPRRLDPRVRGLWWLVGGITSTVVLMITLVFDVLVLPRTTGGLWNPGWLSAGVALAAVVLAGIVPALRYRRWRYALRQDDLWLRRGILWVTVSVIPYRRLQFVDTDQGPLERLAGLASVVVHTAAPGISGRIPGLDAEEAERLRERLAHLGPTPDDPT